MAYTPHYPTISIGRQMPEKKPKTLYKEWETFYIPIVAITVVFGAAFILGPLFVRKGPYIGIIRCCIMLSAFTIWLFWVTIYIAQMNPLMGPRLHNTTAAWLGHVWGKNPKALDEMLEENE